MKRIYTLLFVALSAMACSDSDEKSGDKLYFTVDEVQRPFYAYAEMGVNGDGESRVLVFADRESEVVLFDVVPDETGEDLVENVSYSPDSAGDVTFYVDNSFYSEITVNDETRLKGFYSGNFKDAEGTEKYIECVFDLKKDTEN